MSQTHITSEDKSTLLQGVMTIAKMWNLLGQSDAATIEFLISKGAKKEQAELLLGLSKAFHEATVTR